jgi:hypothetical protein
MADEDEDGLDPEVRAGEMLHELRSEMREAVTETLADPVRTRAVVNGAYAALALMMVGDMAPELTLGARAAMYDKASLLLASAVMGGPPSEPIAHQEVWERLFADLPQDTNT